MQEKHKQILRDLDVAGTKQYCLIPGRNLVGRITALVNGRRLSVAITKTRFGYIAAVDYDGMIRSRWSRTPSAAVTLLATDLKTKVK